MAFMENISYKIEEIYRKFILNWDLALKINRHKKLTKRTKCVGKFNFRNKLKNNVLKLKNLLENNNGKKDKLSLLNQAPRNIFS